MVSGADAIKVVLDNDEEYEAQLVGLDTITDLAVLKIDADNLVAATFGNSDQIEVGETAIAIGNPGGLFNSVTQGIISAASRPVTTSDGTTTVYIQHDAAISPATPAVRCSTPTARSSASTPPRSPRITTRALPSPSPSTRRSPSSTS